MKKVKAQYKNKQINIGSKAQLIISTSRHNIYATLIQIEQPRKVIFSLSGGQVKEVEKSVNRRFKTSPGTIINLAKKIYEESLLRGIFSVDIVLKVSTKFVIRSLIYNLKLHV